MILGITVVTSSGDLKEPIEEGKPTAGVIPFTTFLFALVPAADTLIVRTWEEC